MLLRHSWTPFLHFYPSLIYLHFPFHPPTCHRYNASFPFLFRSPLTRSSLSFPAYLFHSPTACFSPFPISNYIFHYLARSYNSLNPWICYSLIFLNLSCFEYFSWYFLFFISFIILLFERKSRYSENFYRCFLISLFFFLSILFSPFRILFFSIFIFLFYFYSRILRFVMLRFFFATLVFLFRRIQTFLSSNSITLLLSNFSIL